MAVPRLGGARLGRDSLFSLPIRCDHPAVRQCAFSHHRGYWSPGASEILNEVDCPDLILLLTLATSAQRQAFFAIEPFDSFVVCPPTLAAQHQVEQRTTLALERDEHAIQRWQKERCRS
jgi:hypothetical protein